MATVCAFNQTAVADRVSFLGCMDDSKENKALHAAKECADGSGVKFKELESCYNGQEGTALLGIASKIFNAKSIHSVPHTFVDGKNVDADFKPLQKALCAAGSTASVCKANSSSCYV